ncbi:PAS domain-containing protein [Phaeobacter sp. QD34_3]|uniref:PAS domain-containing protein n=1 Tax=unclassified Phaeobacter TaxID=2621772 RepID=UPI00237F5A85|nr:MULTISPECIES: PAS domain-containing protein [unclassified Phaeobacter]MDE4131781.1 PAS domain-containing protein [Phaeobacter sp. QD34_3]MDE4135130.1 PAS domain-containing protein [Phaeobacter sp. QD34_24]MDE4175033.1 PAS domain-containing protein [Phaeobacter sp. PT47_59]
MFFGGRKSSGQNKGHDKVVPMNNFRSRTPVSALRQAEAYWTALRRGDDIPSRSQIDPRGLENILSQTFILERVAPGIARFRLAGQKVNEMAGMEVRGMPITAFFTPEARKQLSAALEHMFDAPAIVELELQTQATRLHGSRGARMLLLPLRSDLGDVSRALGVFVSEGNPTGTSQRFSVTSIEMRTISQAASDAEFKAKPREEKEDINTPNPGFAATEARFKTEKSILDEARSLADRGSLRSEPKAEISQNPASGNSPKKRGSHLRLVVSRD